jgi:hypothetical protein
MPDLTRDAVATVARAFAAVEAGDWPTVADLTAPDVIDQYRAREIAHLLAWAEYMATRDQTGANGYSSDDVIKPELLRAYGHVKVERVEGAPTIADLAGASPKAFLATWLRVANDTNRRFPIGPAAVPRQIIGAVIEGDALAHVVYRGMDWIRIVRTQIASLKLLGGRWALMDNKDVLRSPDFWLEGLSSRLPRPAA